MVTIQNEDPLSLPPPTNDPILLSFIQIWQRSHPPDNKKHGMESPAVLVSTGALMLLGGTEELTGQQGLRDYPLLVLSLVRRLVLL